MPVWTWRNPRPAHHISTVTCPDSVAAAANSHQSGPRRELKYPRTGAPGSCQACGWSSNPLGRRLVGADRAVAAALARAVSGAPAGGGPAGSAGHSVRPAPGRRLAVPDPGAGVRLGADLLAAPGPQAAGRRLRNSPHRILLAGLDTDRKS